MGWWATLLYNEKGKSPYLRERNLEMLEKKIVNVVILCLVDVVIFILANETGLYAKIRGTIHAKHFD